MELRREIDSLEDLHGALAEVDPQAAQRLHPNDRVRLIRALEVHRLTGRTLSEIHQEGAGREPLVAEVAWLDREDLRERIGTRLQLMLDQGYLEEVRGVQASAWRPDSKPLKSFAYRHLLAHIEGKMDLEEALRRTERDTWRFARKQRSWARAMGWEPTDVGAAMEQGVRCLSQDPSF
jgi:tRNA dimethylallyltransferase